jgi:hypothetical protein
LRGNVEAFEDPARLWPILVYAAAAARSHGVLAPFAEWLKDAAAVGLYGQKAAAHAARPARVVVLIHDGYWRGLIFSPR